MQKVEYYENGGDASVQVWWEIPFLSREIIPQSRLYSGGAPTSPPTGTTGDVDCDGDVDIVDALEIAMFYVGIIPEGELCCPACADTNCDGTVDIVDALLVAQYYVGLISQFC